MKSQTACLQGLTYYPISIEHINNLSDELTIDRQTTIQEIFGRAITFTVQKRLKDFVRENSHNAIVDKPFQIIVFKEGTINLCLMGVNGIRNAQTFNLLRAPEVATKDEYWNGVEAHIEKAISDKLGIEAQKLGEKSFPRLIWRFYFTE